MTDALVLSGGNLKGAYQAGVIAGLLDQGFRPDIVTGISVGALNAGFIAAHQAVLPETGKALTDFWLERVTKPGDLVKRRAWWDIAWRVLTKKWDGLADTDPMAKIVRETLGSKLPVTEPGIRVQVGAVNLETGSMEYHACQSPNFLDAVLASTAEPLVMPMRPVAGRWCYDGGIRDIAPLRQAIVMGATRIVAVLCQAEGLAPFDPKNRGDALKVVSRVTSIAADEILENDVRRAQTLNAVIRSVPQPMAQTRGWTMKVEGREYRHVPVLVVRPQVPFTVDVTDFAAADIKQMVSLGYTDGTLARLEDAA